MNVLNPLGKGGVESSILSGGTIPCNRRAAGAASVQKISPGGKTKRRTTGAGESNSLASTITSITLARLLARNLAAKAAKIRT